MRKTLAVALSAALLFAAEPFRPAFHFSPLKNWTNDPCGAFYKDGVYHLFFQYNPFGDQWGHMTWGHATSPDLVHWSEVEPALREENGVMIFTGSSVVEPSGRIASIYTGHLPGPPAHQNQNLAFSTDARTWTKYSGNPVLDIGAKVTDFRDPKVLWHAPSRRWVMVVMLPREHKASFYNSTDLIHWTHLSDFGPAGVAGRIWECPDFYELPVDGDAKNMRWVLKVGLSGQHVAGGSGEQYFIGRFDGTSFVNDNPPDKVLWMDYGPDCYCEFTFSNAPATRAVGWMSNWVYASKIPTSPWRGQMTAPREFALKTTPAGIRLFQYPARELDKIRTAKPGGDPEIFEMRATVKVPAGKRAEWTLMDGLKVGYDAGASELYVDRRAAGETGFDPRFGSRYSAPLKLGGRALDLRVLVDRSSVEVFAMQGEIVFTTLVFPRKHTPVSYTGPKAKTQIYELRP